MWARCSRQRLLAHTHLICAWWYHPWGASADRLPFVRGSMRVISEPSKLKIQQNIGLKVRQKNNCIYKKYGPTGDIKEKKPRNGCGKCSVTLVLPRYEAFLGNVSSHRQLASFIRKPTERHSCETYETSRCISYCLHIHAITGVFFSSVSWENWSNFLMPRGQLY